MGGATMLPSSLHSPRGGAAATSRACASRPRLDPACIGISGTAAAAAKGSKRPGSSCEDEPPSKRRRAGGDAAIKNPPMSLAEKDGVNRLLLSLLPPGSSPRQVNPLPDLFVRVLQENGTMCCGSGEDDETEIEIDVHALGDEALRAIKNRVGAYLDGIARRDAAWSQSKDGVVGQSATRSIPSKAASRCIPSKSASKIIPCQAVSKSIPPQAASNIIPCQVVSKSIPPRAAPTGTKPKAASKRILSRAVLKRVSPKAVPLLPAPPKPSESKESVSEPVKTAASQSSLSSSPWTSSSSLPASAEPTKSIKELLADAREAMQEVVRRRELEQLRAAARREVEQMVRTAEFNDPYIDVQDAFK